MTVAVGGVVEKVVVGKLSGLGAVFKEGLVGFVTLVGVVIDDSTKGGTSAGT